ncbi:hypothetical protein [Kitasatospora sp. NPDC057015]|uniref:hypothetical protein n=1 Tax=Kitasatospora sp. NPDC057015 TaxID=3346001 RepID=UPI003629F32C
MTTWQPRMLRALVFATACVAMAAGAHHAVSRSGTPLPLPALALAFGGAAGGSWLLGGRRRGFPLIAAWMTTTQAALHLLFEYAPALGGAGGRPTAAPVDWAALLLCNTRDPAALGTTPEELARAAGLDPETLSTSAAWLARLGPAGHQHPAAAGHGALSGAHATAGGTGAGSLTAGHDPLMSAHALSIGMVGGHLLAALACALLLWRGDAAIAGLFTLLRALACVLLPALSLPGPGTAGPSTAVRPARRAARLPRPALLTYVLVRRGPPAFDLAA